MTLALPVWLIIGAWFYSVGVVYYEAGALGQLLDDTGIFSRLVTVQTACVALFTLAWAVWLLPWVFYGQRPRLRFWCAHASPLPDAAHDNQDPRPTAKRDGTDSEQRAGG
jgi:hypothetical protein